MRYRPRRKPTDFRATLRFGGDECHVYVGNATDSGIQVSGVDRFLPCDTEVELVIRHFRVRAVVIWSRDRSMGLALAAPLPQALRAILGRGPRAA